MYIEQTNILEHIKQLLNHLNPLKNWIRKQVIKYYKSLIFVLFHISLLRTKLFVNLFGKDKKLILYLTNNHKMYIYIIQ